MKFYDVGQGLGVLLTLPDGRRILVDTGVLPSWPACTPCAAWSRRFLDELENDVSDRQLDTVWITHQHADHNGNADTVMREYAVTRFVDNGTRGHTRGQGKRVDMLRALASERGSEHRVIAPGRAASPWPATAELKLTPVVPDAWPVACDEAKGVNNCSIGLRVDYCETSILFTGDAEHEAERVLPIAPVTLLQVGHHGSRTSSTSSFLEAVSPSYAVISSGGKNEGTNATYCHPVLETIERLNLALGPGEASLWAFAGGSCKKQRPSDWREVKTSQNLFVTARDGHITLETNGDGTFRRR